MTPQKLLIPSDGNILELVQTIKGKELIHEFKFIKSDTKEGVLMTITDENLTKNLNREIFKPI
jgi:hypothetical protein